MSSEPLCNTLIRKYSLSKVDRSVEDISFLSISIRSKYVAVCTCMRESMRAVYRISSPQMCLKITISAIVSIPSPHRCLQRWAWIHRPSYFELVSVAINGLYLLIQPRDSQISWETVSSLPPRLHISDTLFQVLAEHNSRSEIVVTLPEKNFAVKKERYISVNQVLPASTDYRFIKIILFWFSKLFMALRGLWYLLICTFAVVRRKMNALFAEHLFNTIPGAPTMTAWVGKSTRLWSPK